MSDARNGVRDIVVVAAPRSGTNFFCECLGALEGVSAYYEIFNPRGVMGAGDADTLAHLSGALGRRIGSAQDADLVRFFRRQPLEAVGQLREGARARGDSALCYKIFPGQITDEALAALLSLPGAIVMLVVRRRLDVFVSYQTARRHDVWKNRDTSDLLLDVDADAFLEWSTRIDAWYENALESTRAAATPTCIFDYDADIDMPKAQLVARLAEALGQHGLSVTPGAGLGRTSFRKQDKRSGPFKKIANADALRAALRSRRAYNYALAAPLSDAPKPRAGGSAS